MSQGIITLDLSAVEQQAASELRMASERMAYCRGVLDGIHRALAALREQAAAQPLPEHLDAPDAGSAAAALPDPDDD